MITKLLVKNILEKAHSYKWSLQGLGMLRLYLSDEVRLHVWDTRYKFYNASPVHDHPWDLSSQVIAGQIRNVIYTECDLCFGRGHCLCVGYKRQTIKCGSGSCLVGEPKVVRLLCKTQMVYEGEEYHQAAEEIHETKPLDGTVTIVTRTFKEDRDHAHVFWPAEITWGSAEPRPATSEEIEAITQNALNKWFYQKDAATAKSISQT